MHSFIQAPARPRALTGALLLAVSCHSPDEEPFEASYSVAPPAPAPSHYEREYVGEVHAAARAELRVRVPGTIEAVLADEGERVKAGDVLFRVSARESEQDLRRARAVVRSALAEIEVTRVEQRNVSLLHENEIVGAGEKAAVEAKLRALQAKLEEARAAESQAAINLEYSRVKAPFDGIINRVHHKQGSTVAVGDVLTTLTNPDEMWVYFRVSEREYLDMQASPRAAPKQVRLRLANGAPYSEPGVIDAVESEFDAATGNIAFRARFPNPHQLLKHGASAKVLVETPVTENALLVPQAATFEVQDHVYLYVVDANNVARLRRIAPERRLGPDYLVSSGLSRNDRIIIGGIQNVKEGERIAALPTIVESPPTL